MVATATSSVLPNGTKGRKFKHRTGLRQGNTLSPMLFILALESLQKLLEKARSTSAMTPMQCKAARFRISLYANDSAVFVNPLKEDAEVLKEVFAAFGEASGLCKNLDKSGEYPIRCEAINLDTVLQSLPCQVKCFHCTYLGLPLSIRKLKGVEVQPLVDKIEDRLPSWKGKLLDKAGRLTLVLSVLTSVPIWAL